jgi:hypothetical protein
MYFSHYKLLYMQCIVVSQNYCKFHIFQSSQITVNAMYFSHYKGPSRNPSLMFTTTTTTTSHYKLLYMQCIVVSQNYCKFNIF